MTPERWRQISDVFHRAQAYEAGDRDAFLASVCGGDAPLRAEVESMLAAHADAGAFGDRPVDESALGRDRLAPGTVVGSYRVDALIGAGGMGEVYRAYDQRLQRSVALKLLQSDDARAAGRRVLREARAAAGLSHPSICTIYEVGDAGDRTYISMELVEGEALDARLAASPVSATEARQIAIDLADAVAHAHARGIVHGDLKPANVLVSRGGRVKVLDFGLARRVVAADGATATQPSFAAGGVIAGTLGYMAPEQLRGAGADERTDVWALGVIFHEIAEASSGSLPAPIVARCVEHDRSRRYANAGELSAALASSSLRSRRMRLVALVAAAAVVAGGVWIARARWFGPLRIDSIAVLPFSNASGDLAHEFVGVTVADQVGVDLGAVGSLKVIAGQATQGYKLSAKSAAVIAQELGTSSILEGSTLVIGSTVRVTVRLIDGASQRQLWAKTYEDDVRDVLGTSRLIARAVVDEVKPALTSDERQRIARAAAPVDPAVLELVHAGRPFDATSVADFLRKRAYLEEAIRIAPDYAPAHVTLAQWFNVGLNQNLIGAPGPAYVEARAALETALRLDPDLAEAHAAFAGLLMTSAWDWNGALLHSDRAVALNPNSFNAHGRKRHLLTVTRRFDDAITELRRFRSLYPTTPNYGDGAGFTYLAAGRYAEIGPALEREHATDIESAPNRFALRWLAVSDVLTGRADEARRRCEAIVARAAEEPRTLSVCGFVFARTGQAAHAAALRENLRLRSAQGRYVDPFLLATIDAGLDARNDMFASLTRAADEHSPLVVELDASRWFDGFHADPRYGELVRRIGFPQSQAVPR